MARCACLGLMIGIELVKDDALTPAAAEAEAVCDTCFKAGVLIGVGGTNGNVVRISSSLVIQQDQLDTALDVLEGAIAEVASGVTAAAGKAQTMADNVAAEVVFRIPSCSMGKWISKACPPKFTRLTTKAWSGRCTTPTAITSKPLFARRSRPSRSHGSWEVISGRDTEQDFRRDRSPSRRVRAHHRP